MNATKHDEAKNRLDLWPPDAYEAIGKVLTYGAAKYAPRGWEEGMEWSRVYAALQRHLNAWWRGEDKDPETGYSHLWHVGCNVAFLIAYEMRGVGEDDRRKLTHAPGNGLPPPPDDLPEEHPREKVPL